MSVADIRAVQACGDLYPSRDGRQAGFLERQDPVVYATDTDSSPIDAALVQQYEQQGFLVLEDVFTPDEVACFQQELERLCHASGDSEAVITEPGSHEVRSVFRVHDTNFVFRKLAADPRLAGLARYLLNDEVYVHQSRVNYKPGFRGREFYWHSDFETWHVEDGMPRMRALSMSIALTENHAHNGALMLIPGSHRRYAVCEGTTPPDHYKSSLKRQELGVPSDACLQELVRDGGVVTADVKPGSVLVFDCNTMHGSNSNITPYPRSNVFFVYNALSNRVVSPFGNQPPRPEILGNRSNIAPLTPAPFQVAPRSG